MRAATLAGFLLLIACASAPPVHELPLARSPDGVHTQVELNRHWGGGSAVGELLEVREDGLLLNISVPGTTAGASKQVTLYPYARIKRAEFAYIGGVQISELTSERSRVGKHRLRLASRFPQGLSPELLAELLTAQGQTQLVVAGKEHP